MSGLYLGLLWALCAVVFFTDWMFRRVPNRLLIAVLVTYLLIRLADRAGFAVGTAVDIQSSLVGGVLAFVFLLPFYAFRAMGAGDVKFFALLGVLLGPVGLVVVWLVSTALNGGHAVLQWMLGADAMPTIANLGRVAGAWIDGENGRLQRLSAWVHDRRQGRKGIPYAAYMAIAALAQPWISARL
jgi:prepilin peptidase CpaA